MGLIGKTLSGLETFIRVTVFAALLFMIVACMGGALVSFILEYQGVGLGFLYAALALICVLLYRRRRLRRESLGMKTPKFLNFFVFGVGLGTILGVVFMLLSLPTIEDAGDLNPFALVVICSLATPVVTPICILFGDALPDFDLFD